MGRMNANLDLLFSFNLIQGNYLEQGGVDRKLKSDMVYMVELVERIFLYKIDHLQVSFPLKVHERLLNKT